MLFEQLSQIFMRRSKKQKGLERFLRKPKKQKGLEKLILILLQHAETWERLLRSIRLLVILTMPFFGLGAFAAGFWIGISNLDEPIILTTICQDEFRVLDSKTSASDIADKMIERAHPEVKGSGVEELDAELLEERQFYYQLVKQCRKRHSKN